MICTPQQTLCIMQVIKSSEMEGGACDVRGAAEVHTGFWWWDVRERHHLDYLGTDGGILKRIFNKWNGGHGPH